MTPQSLQAVFPAAEETDAAAGWIIDRRFLAAITDHVWKSGRRVAVSSYDVQAVLLASIEIAWPPAAVGETGGPPAAGRPTILMQTAYVDGVLVIYDGGRRYVLVGDGEAISDQIRAELSLQPDIPVLRDEKLAAELIRRNASVTAGHTGRHAANKDHEALI